jgi:hypothetical protein
MPIDIFHIIFAVAAAERRQRHDIFATLPAFACHAAPLLRRCFIFASAIITRRHAAFRFRLDISSLFSCFAISLPIFTLYFLFVPLLSRCAAAAAADAACRTRCRKQEPSRRHAAAATRCRRLPLMPPFFFACRHARQADIVIDAVFTPLPDAITPPMFAAMPRCCFFDARHYYFFFFFFFFRHYRYIVFSLVISSFAL